NRYHDTRNETSRKLFRTPQPPSSELAGMNDPSSKPSWWQRLSGGLNRTSASIGSAVTDLVAKRKLDQEMLDEIEDVLIRADLGIESAAKIAAAVGDGRYDKSITPDEVKTVVATEVEKVLAPVALPLAIGEPK